MVAYKIERALAAQNRLDVQPTMWVYCFLHGQTACGHRKLTFWSHPRIFFILQASVSTTVIIQRMAKALSLWGILLLHW
jgi:hypothetical protein